MPVNLYELKPRRNAEWEPGEGDRVVVLVPKFRNPVLVRWLTPMLSKPFFRIKLDDYGSFIWNQCDGETSVSDIAVRMKERFGETVEPVEGRIGSFLNRLERGDLLVVRQPKNTQSIPEHS